jgi:hypothetical protein
VVDPVRIDLAVERDVLDVVVQESLGPGVVLARALGRGERRRRAVGRGGGACRAAAAIANRQRNRVMTASMEERGTAEGPLRAEVVDQYVTRTPIWSIRGW